jgi:hypothetical protein
MERQLRAVLDELYPNGTSDSVSGRTRKSRQQTKDLIAELFLRGGTQGKAPGSEWAAVNAVVEYGDWLRPMRSSGQRFARALETDLRRPARCSSSRLHGLGRLGGAHDPRRACRDRPAEAPAYSRTMDGQGVDPSGRFPTRSVCNGYPN